MLTGARLRDVLLATGLALLPIAGGACEGVDVAGDPTPVVTERAALKAAPAAAQAASQGTGGMCKPAHLSLTGGQPMKGIGGGNSMKIAPVVWGPSSKLNYSLSVVDNFYGNAFVTGSPWYSWIRREYHLPNVSPLSTKALTLTSANASKTLVNDTDIQAEITSHLQDGTLPLDANHSVASILYVIHFPPTVQVEFGNDPGNQLCGGANGTIIKNPGACAFNQNPSTFKYLDGVTIHYAVVPDLTAGGCPLNCSFGQAPTNALTMVESHEVIEAITDPIGGWADTSNSIGPDGVSPTGCGQIGDICNGQGITTFGGGSTFVQRMWSNASDQCEGNEPGAPADFTGAGTSGILLVGDTDPGANNPQFHVAESTRSGNGTTATLTASDLIDSAGSWPSLEKIGLPVTGDFDGDGFADVALIDASTTTFPMAINTGGDGFTGYTGVETTTKPPPALAKYVGADFLFLAPITPIPPVTGDFNGDGLTDIAVVGGINPSAGEWHYIPVAFASNDGEGGFWCTWNPDNGFNDYVLNNVGTPQLVAADFNGDGLSDLALVGLTQGQNVGKPFIAVAYAIQDSKNRFQGYGSFTNVQVPLVAPSGHGAADFNTWASLPGVKAVAGDFDGDGYGDIALAGPTGLSSVPIAFIRNPGASANFTYVLSTALSTTSFASEAATANAQLVAGDFDGDGVSDLALTGPTSWNFVGLGLSPTYSSGIGVGALSWTQDSAGLATFAQISGKPNVNAISADHGGPFLSKSDVKIDVGGGAVAPFVADIDSSGGATKTRTNTIDVSHVVNPAPAAVYQSQRYSNFTYTVPSFSASSVHTVRLHFAETNPANNGTGKRLFNVAINGTTVLSNFDVFATSGALNRALIEEFRVPADSSGRFVIKFTTVTDAAFVSGIEVL